MQPMKTLPRFLAFALALALPGLLSCDQRAERLSEAQSHRMAMVQFARTGGGERSSEWPALSKRYRAEHPRCAACGTMKGIQVHHVIPFHTDPSKELDENNLISLCKGGCHLKIGHGGSYQFYNPHAREDAALALANPESFQDVVLSARAHRLKNKPGSQNDE